MVGDGGRWWEKVMGEGRRKWSLLMPSAPHGLARLQADGDEAGAHLRRAVALGGRAERAHVGGPGERLREKA